MRANLKRVCWIVAILTVVQNVSAGQPQVISDSKKVKEQYEGAQNLEAVLDTFCKPPVVHVSFRRKSRKVRACEEILKVLELKVDQETMDKQPPKCKSEMVYLDETSNFSQDVWSCACLSEEGQKHNIFIHFLRNVILHGSSFGVLKELSDGRFETDKVITDVSV